MSAVVENLPADAYADDEVKAQAQRAQNNGAGHDDVKKAQQQAEFVEKLTARRFDPTREPGPLRVTYSIAGVPVATPGNLAAVTAGVKTGKTAFVSGMLGATMADISNAGSGNTYDCLSVKSSNPQGLAVVHIDTEQSPDDHWRLVNVALRRAGAEMPSWLHSYCLTDLGQLECFLALQTIIERAANEHGGIHSCIIDGVADLVTDVNDAAEANGFVTKLHATAIHYDCPIVGVLHFNPNSDKSRGHLGSQLERKAESNLTLKKEDEVTVIYSTKQRRQPILESTGPRFRWDNEAGMHVSCGTVTDQRRQDMIFDRDEVFGERQALRFAELTTTAKTTLGISDRTAARRVKDWCQAGLIQKSVANLWAKQD